MDCSLPGFSVHGILQARTLEWVAISFSNESGKWKWSASNLKIYTLRDKSLPVLISELSPRLGSDLLSSLGFLHASLVQLSPLCGVTLGDGKYSWMWKAPPPRLGRYCLVFSVCAVGFEHVKFKVPVEFPNGKEQKQDDCTEKPLWLESWDYAFEKHISTSWLWILVWKKNITPISALSGASFNVFLLLWTFVSLSLVPWTI